MKMETNILNCDVSNFHSGQEFYSDRQCYENVAKTRLFCTVYKVSPNLEHLQKSGNFSLEILGDT